MARRKQQKGKRKLRLQDKAINIVLANPLNPDIPSQFIGKRKGGQLGYVHDSLRIGFLVLYYVILFLSFVLINYFSNGVILFALDSLIGSNISYYFPYLTISPFTWLSTWWKTGQAKFYYWGWQDDDFVLFRKREDKGDGDGGDKPGEVIPKKPQIKLSEQVMNLVFIIFVTVLFGMLVKKILPVFVTDILKRYGPGKDTTFANVAEKEVRDIIADTESKTDEQNKEIITNLEGNLNDVKKQLNDTTKLLQGELNVLRAKRKESAVKMGEAEMEAEAKIEDVATVIAAVDMNIDDDVKKVENIIETNVNTIRQVATKRKRQGAKGGRKKKPKRNIFARFRKPKRSRSEEIIENVQKKRRIGEMAVTAQTTAYEIGVDVNEAIDAFEWNVEDPVRENVQTILGIRRRTERLQQEIEQVEDIRRRLTEFGKYQKLG